MIQLHAGEGHPLRRLPIGKRMPANLAQRAAVEALDGSRLAWETSIIPRDLSPHLGRYREFSRILAKNLALGRVIDPLVLLPSGDAVVGPASRVADKPLDAPTCAKKLESAIYFQ